MVVLPESETVVIIKPESFEDNHVLMIQRRIIQTGMTIAGYKELVLTRDQAAAFYVEHEGKLFFEDTVARLCSGTSGVMVARGLNAITVCKELRGEWDESKRKTGTIRGDLMKPGDPNNRNFIHTSADVEAAQRELHWAWRGILD